MNLTITKPIGRWDTPNLSSPTLRHAMRTDPGQSEETTCKHDYFAMAKPGWFRCHWCKKEVDLGA